MLSYNIKSNWIVVLKLLKYSYYIQDKFAYIHTCAVRSYSYHKNYDIVSIFLVKLLGHLVKAGNGPIVFLLNMVKDSGFDKN